MDLSSFSIRRSISVPFRQGSRYAWLAALASLLLQQAFTGTLRAQESSERLGRVAIPFVANSGPNYPSVAYYAQTFAGTVYVTKDGKIVYSLPGKRESRPVAMPRKEDRLAAGPGWSLTESVVRGKARPSAIHEGPTRVSSFIGNDPARWKSDLPAYAAVSLGEVWPGVSMELKARAKSVEKIFTVKPRANPSRIRMRMAGARSLRLNEEGGLVVETGLGVVRFTPPSAYQQRRSVRESVKVAYVLKGRDYGFRVGAHDPTLPVVIDPLVQSTYLGGIRDDFPYALAIHPTSGDVYVTGSTTSTDFPGTAGGAQPANAGGCGGFTDAFVARLTADLTTLKQATYLGGTCDDYSTALAIHPTSGDVYVAGYTNSTDFPGTTGGAQPANAGVPGSFTADVFAARLTADLTGLTKATYLGGTGDEYTVALSIHPTSGDVYVAGWTLSTNFPGTTGGAQPANAGGVDTFIARLTADLTGLTRATYLGGSGDDSSQALTIHPTSGDVYVAGNTNSTNFPGTTGGAQPANAGPPDAFIARLTADLTTLTQSTHLGGGGESASSLAIHPTSGDVYVAGSTNSPNFPGTTGGAQPTKAGDFDAFIARLTANLTTLTRATYLGGSGLDYATAMAIHPTSGDVYVAGLTISTDFPRTIGGAQFFYGGGERDAFAAHLTADLTTLTRATYLGGSDDDLAFALAIHPTSGDVYVAGRTKSTNFPSKTGGAQAANAGAYDVFVARLTLDLAAPPTGFFTLAPCRVADTRGPSPDPLRANTVRDFPVAGICGIPSSATAVVINLAVVLPSATGDLRVYPTGRTVPLASAINFRSGIVRANNATVVLGTTGQISVQCDMPSGSTHFFFDVYGYFQ